MVKLLAIGELFFMNIWHNINPKKITPTGCLLMDRILYTSTHYPANYGFIPRTYADDGDPLDVLVVCSETIAPLTLVQCYPIGVIRMIDNGRNDDKIIAIPKHDPN